MKSVNANHQISHHRFLNSIAAGIVEMIEDQTDLKLTSGGKVDSGTQITLTLTGQKTVADEEELERVSNKVRQQFDALKNPADLESLIK
jgi:hypothetical protein